MPIPGCRRVGEPSTWRNRSKTCGRSLSGMPAPSSSTLTRHRSDSRSMRTTIRPKRGVNLIALTSRFQSTCWSRRGSARTAGRSSGSGAWRSVTPRASAIRRTVSTARETMSAMETSRESSVSVPRSSRARSSRSSIRARSSREEWRICRSPRSSVSGAIGSSPKRSVQPTIEVSGVRSSWFTFCRNWSFRRLARSQLGDGSRKPGVQPGVLDQEGRRVGENDECVGLFGSEAARPVRRGDEPDRLALRLERDEDRVGRAFEPLEGEVRVGIAGDVVRDVDLARLEDHARDRGAVDRDDPLARELPREIPAGPRRFEPVRVRVVKEEPNALGAGEDPDRLGGAREHFLEVGRRMRPAQERVEAVQRLDPALDAPAHAADRAREPSELVLRLEPGDLEFVPAAHGFGGLDQVAHGRRDPTRGPEDRAEDRREQEHEEHRRLAAQLRDPSLDRRFRIRRDGREAVGGEPLDEDPSGRGRAGGRQPMDAPAEPVGVDRPLRPEHGGGEAAPLGVVRLGEALGVFAAPAEDLPGPRGHEERVAAAVEREPEVAGKAPPVHRLRHVAPGVELVGDGALQCAVPAPDRDEEGDVAGFPGRGRARERSRPDRAIALGRPRRRKSGLPIESKALERTARLADPLVEVDPGAHPHRSRRGPEGDGAERRQAPPRLDHQRLERPAPREVAPRGRISGARKRNVGDRVGPRAAVPDVPVFVRSGQRLRGGAAGEGEGRRRRKRPRRLLGEPGAAVHRLRAPVGVLLDAHRLLAPPHGFDAGGRRLLDAGQAPVEHEDHHGARQRESEEERQQEPRGQPAARIGTPPERRFHGLREIVALRNN